MSGIESCPTCGGPSFDGEPCRPQCDPGMLKRRGIELTPATEATVPRTDADREAIVPRSKQK